jgi:hypothetical protein
MLLIFQFNDKNHGSVSAVLQQDVEKYFPVNRRGSRDLPEFETNFQGSIFQKGFWEGKLNENTFVWLLLGVVRKRDHSRLRRLMSEKSDEIKLLEFADDNELKKFLFAHPEFSLKWFSK